MGLLAAVALGAARGMAADLTDMSLEDLTKVTVVVTSAARKSQDLRDVASSVYVLTSDDIRRSGARNIPEALRFVPGLDVFQVDGNSWAVGSRGFTSTYDSHLLVLIDGRSVFSPVFSGVIWSLQQVLLEDVERIEVIRGPGGALWGVNAVNGVINIITRNAADTSGVLGVVAGGGAPGWGLGAVRQGGPLGQNGYYRIYAQVVGNAAGVTEDGRRGADDFLSRLAGFRADLNPTPDDTVMLSGSVAVNLRGDASLTSALTPPYITEIDQRNHDLEANLNGHWTRSLGGGAEVSLQASYTREEANRPDVGAITDVFDLQAQHRFAPTGWQDVIWGAEVRLTDTSVRTSPVFGFTHPFSVQSVENVFVQDDIALWPDRLHLIVGGKFERADFAGFVFEPTIRAVYTPDAENTLWAAVSRGVRIPSVSDRNVQFLAAVVPNGLGDGLPLAIQNNGNSGFHAEDLLAFETGYRWHPTPRVSLDASLLWNFYRNLESIETGSISLVAGATPYYLLTMPFANKVRANGKGGELALEWRPLPWWRLRGSYSFLDLVFRQSADSTDTVQLGQAGQSPRHQVILQSSADLGADFQLDLTAKYTSPLHLFTGDVTAGLPQRWTGDVRLSYRGVQGVELSLVGQNLLSTPRIAFRPDTLNWLPTKVGPIVYAKALFHF